MLGQAGGRGSGGEVGTLIYSQGRAERLSHGLDVDQSHLGRLADLGWSEELSPPDSLQWLGGSVLVTHVRKRVRRTCVEMGW